MLCQNSPLSAANEPGLPHRRKCGKLTTSVKTLLENEEAEVPPTRIIAGLSGGPWKGQSGMGGAWRSLSLLTPFRAQVRPLLSAVIHAVICTKNIAPPSFFSESCGLFFNPVVNRHGLFSFSKHACAGPFSDFCQFRDNLCYHGNCTAPLVGGYKHIY